jgi:hypothetical protein
MAPWLVVTGWQVNDASAGGGGGERLKFAARHSQCGIGRSVAPGEREAVGAIAGERQCRVAAHEMQAEGGRHARFVERVEGEATVDRAQRELEGAGFLGVPLGTLEGIQAQLPYLAPGCGQPRKALAREYRSTGLIRELQPVAGDVPVISGWRRCGIDVARGSPMRCPLGPGVSSAMWRASEQVRVAAAKAGKIRDAARVVHVETVAKRQDDGGRTAWGQRAGHPGRALVRRPVDERAQPPQRRPEEALGRQQFCLRPQCGLYGAPCDPVPVITGVMYGEVGQQLARLAVAPLRDGHPIARDE